MKVFQTFRKSLGDIGIHLLHSADNFNRLNSKNVFIFAFICISLVSSIMKLLYECETIFDYSESIFTIASTTVAFLFFPILWWKAPKVFKLFDNLDRFIEKREFCKLNSSIVLFNRKWNFFILPGVTDPIKQLIYDDANTSVEKWNRLIYFVVAKFTPAMPLIMNICFICVTYLKRDLTDEDYVLPFPLWWVSIL